MADIESAGTLETGATPGSKASTAPIPDAGDNKFQGADDRDFSFLDSGDTAAAGPDHPLPGETLEEWQARIEEQAETGDKLPDAKADEAKADEKPVEDKAETKEEPKAEAKTEPKADADTEQVRKKADAWDQFNTALEKHPEDLAKFVLGQMSDSQKQALLREVAPSLLEKDTPQPYDWDAEENAPASNLEEAIKARWDHIEKLPDLAKKIESLEAKLGETGDTTIRRLDVPITQASIRVELALAKLDAISEAFGIDLPDADMNAIIDALKDGRKTFRSAVRETLGSSYKESVAAHKQRNAERPNTPGNSSTRKETMKEGSDLLSIIKSGVAYSR